MKSIKLPNEKALKQAILFVWLGERWFMHADDFYKLLRERPRDVINHNYRTLEMLRRKWATDNLSSAQHFRDNPHVYGSSTPEMIARCEALAEQYIKQAEKYARIQLAVATQPLPDSVLQYTPVHPGDHEAAIGQEMNRKNFEPVGPMEMIGEGYGHASSIEDVMKK